MPDPKLESLQDEIARHRRSRRLPRDYYVEKPPFPSAMMVEVTNHCNHRCFFCANTRMQRPRVFLNTDLYQRVIKEAGQLNVKELSLYSTGEPLLHKDFTKFVRYAKQAGIKWVTTTTNGVFLTENLAEQCIDAGIDAFRISINAGDSVTYQIIHGQNHFDRVITNVRSLHQLRARIKAEFRLSVSCIVTDISEDTAENLHQLLDDVVDELVLMPVGPQSGLMRDISEKHRPTQFINRNPNTYYEVPNDYIPCAYPFSRIHLTAEGFLTSCAVDFDGKLIVADVRDSTLLEAWHSKQYAEFRRRHLQDSLRGLQCQTCINSGNTGLVKIQRVKS